MFDEYRFSGSLPEEATTYVIREADKELYEGLTAGKFCYVLNSRQSGKSSLRVRTMRRLRDDGVECAAIDLSAGGIQNVPPEQWYADLIDTLIDSFELDLDFGDWWEENQLNSLVTRFRKFLEEILLAEIKENIVIFIDEIDSVLSLNFPTDDFFAFIRSCYNQRVDNPNYNRLTFCLLGVASPSNLIEDKKRTPFNIGKAISLKGFQLCEAEPLEKGLRDRFDDSQAVIKDILHWTGGQPFLTQKLCQFMVEESLQDNARTVEQVVRFRIIENWESQDEPEHLRTIRDRVLRDEQRAGYLLELYQHIRHSEEQAEVTANDTLEQSELQLSGLVVRQENKLKVYNPIYKEIFDQSWIETQLRNLRPYSENFKFWVASGGSDDSRLLRGKALQDALSWSRDKSLSYQDKQFLAASQAKEREEEIAALEKEAALERERKDREATEKRNQVLIEANNKAQQRISIGTVVLILTLFGAVISGILAGNQVQIAKDAEKRLDEANSKTGIAKNELVKARVDVKATRLEVQRAEEKAQVMQKNAAYAQGKLSSTYKSLQQAEESRKAAELEKAKAKKDALSALKTANDAEEKLLVVRKNQQQAQEALKTAKKGEALAKDKVQKAQKEAERAQQRLTRIDEQVKNVSLLSDLSGELQSKNMQSSADEARRQLGLSYAIRENHKLQQALLLSGIAFAYQRLARRAELLTSSDLQFSVESQDMEELKREKLKTSTFKNAATEAIQTSMKLLQEKDRKISLQEKEFSVSTLTTLGELLKYKNDNQEAIKAYTKAFNLLQSNTAQLTPFNSNTRILNIDTVEFIHGQLIKLLSTKSVQENDLLHQVKESLKEHYYAKLDNLLTLKEWEAANELTIELMIYISHLEDINFNDTGNWNIDEEDMMKFPCRDLQKIDEKWRSRSSGRFGFGVQKQIWQERGNRLEYNWRAYKSFLSEIGWTGEERENYGEGEITLDSKILDRLIKRNRRGTLPLYIKNLLGKPIPSHRIRDLLENDNEWSGHVRPTVKKGWSSVYGMSRDEIYSTIILYPDSARGPRVFDDYMGITNVAETIRDIPIILYPDEWGGGWNFAEEEMNNERQTERRTTPATHRILSRALVCKL